MEELKQRIAFDLLLPLWEGLDSSYKSRYSKDVWEHFENNIRVAAYTSRLSKFFETITKLMPIQVSGRHVERIESLLNSGQEPIILRILRNEASYLVLIIRAEKQKQKEELQKATETIENKPDVQQTLEGL